MRIAAVLIVSLTTCIAFPGSASSSSASDNNLSEVHTVALSTPTTALTLPCHTPAISSSTPNKHEPVSKASNDIANRKVCACLIGMTNDRTIGVPSQINLEKMQRLFTNEVHEHRWRNGGRDILRGNRCNGDEIIHAISKLQVRPDDTLFVYVSAHGAYDPDKGRSRNDPSRGHYFDLDGGKLTRKRLYKAMLSKGARITVLVSDSCNITTLKNAEEIEPLMGGGLPPELTKLEKLLLLHRGQIDINSASQDEFAFFDGDNGGWFTYFFHREFARSDRWQDLLTRSKAGTNNFYQLNRKKRMGGSGQIARLMSSQPKQTPVAFRMQIQRAR